MAIMLGLTLILACGTLWMTGRRFRLISAAIGERETCGRHPHYRLSGNDGFVVLHSGIFRHRSEPQTRVMHSWCDSILIRHTSNNPNMVDDLNSFGQTHGAFDRLVNRAPRKYHSTFGEWPVATTSLLALALRHSASHLHRAGRLCKSFRCPIARISDLDIRKSLNGWGFADIVKVVSDLSVEIYECTKFWFPENSRELQRLPVQRLGQHHIINGDPRTFRYFQLLLHCLPLPIGDAIKFHRERGDDKRCYRGPETRASEQEEKVRTSFLPPRPHVLGIGLVAISFLCALFGYGFAAKMNGPFYPDIQPFIGLVLLIVSGWLLYHSVNLIAYGSWSFPAYPCSAVSMSARPYQGQRQQWL